LSTQRRRDRRSAGPGWAAGLRPAPWIERARRTQAPHEISPVPAFVASSRSMPREARAHPGPCASPRSPRLCVEQLCVLCHPRVETNCNECVPRAQSSENHSESCVSASGTAIAWRGAMSKSPTAAQLNQLTSTIIAAAIRIHQALGPGLLETAYRRCLRHELHLAGLRIESEKPLPLIYRSALIDCAYRADIVVEGSVLVEVKAMEALAPIHSRQLYTYLRVAERRRSSVELRSRDHERGNQARGE
jgi:GxxExxY protein